ncbi:MAG: hypothetical protein SWQ30_23265 [Thermodesulfobacteriota bacterium]|nr:hypothetical protein [Thermodesulfobacteriota bacterium]
MEWLRDPIWQFIGAAVGIVAIIVSYMFFKRQQKQKRIAYEIISSTSLLSVRNEVKSKLQVFFEQKPIENLSLLIIQIYNAGNEPVLSTDYEKPISIGFGDKAEVLEADITGVSPESIQPKIDRTPKAVSLQPLLLNGGDSITLKVLLANFDGNASVTGRIAGVKQISGSGSDRLSPRSFRKDLILIYLLSVAGTCIGILATVIVIATGEILPGIVFSVLGLLIALFPIAGIASVNERTKALLKE